MNNQHPNAPKFCLSFAIWGKVYVDTFANLVLANLLSPNLILSCLEKYGLSSLIYTTPHDAEIIQQNTHFQKLNNLMPIEICPIIDTNQLCRGNKWDIKGICQSKALSYGMKNNLVNIFINGDVLMSDGSLLHCCDLINSGIKVVNILELARVEIESIKPDLLKSHYNPSTNALSFDSKTLVQLGKKHLHEIGKNLFWKKSPSSTWPSIIYWDIGENSILAKSFQLHPMAIDARHLKIKLPEELMPDDGGLIEFLGFSSKDIYTCTDSEKLTCIELSFKNLDYTPDTLPQKNTIRTLWKWACKYSSFDARKNFRRYVFYFKGSANLSYKRQSDRPFLGLYFLYFLFFLLDIKDVFYSVIRRMARMTGLIYLRRKSKGLYRLIKLFFYQFKPMMKLLKGKDKLYYAFCCLTNLREFKRSGRLLKADRKTSPKLMKNLNILAHGNSLTIPYQHIEKELSKRVINDGVSLELIREIFLCNEYLRRFKPTLKANTVFDIGSNRGFFALLAHKALQSKKTVCIEPSELLTPIRHLLFKENKIPFEKVCEFQTFCSSQSSKSSISINQILKDLDIATIDFMKMDVEGAESEIFSKHIEWLDFCKNISMEVHISIAPVYYIPNLLKTKGFDILLTTMQGTPLTERALRTNVHRGCVYLYASKENMLI